MANIPTPRSLSQIEGAMFNAFLTLTGLPTIVVESPVLSIFDAAAQSDLRSSQDIFLVLNSQNLDRAEGTALDRIGADEQEARQTETASSGPVAVNDTSFTKISSKIFQGQPAPIVGSASIFVNDATSFPASGSLYIGRGTVNYEGPLLYTAVTNLGTYWRIDLNTSTKTQSFHNLGETVIVAQGGDRPIPAGSLVQTPQGNVGAAVQFTTVYSATIPDGETQLTNVLVQAQKTGIAGNVAAGNISAFVNPPFAGATVTNPLPFANALPSWDDKTYREAIRDVRQSRSKGTALAIETNVIGITAPDENKTVASAAVVTRVGFPTTLYIDDGSGYEESSEGIALETLIEDAGGGERFFQVGATPPITKAYAETSLLAPFTLVSGAVLAVKVGGVLYQHTFSADEFRNIGNADAFECVASINADSTLAFQARPTANGTKFAIFAEADTDEDIEVVAASTNEIDANEFFGFAAGRNDTMRLYKNDRLLIKDGVVPRLLSESQSTWAPMAAGVTLFLNVDGTGVVTYTFANLDFVNAGTSYTTVASTNSLDAWAAVFNFKIPGITAAVTGDKLTLTSNLGAMSRASLEITGGTMVTSGRLFSFGTAVSLKSQGKTDDYSLNRNWGKLTLAQKLAAGDRLDLGTVNTRAFVESRTLSPLTLNVDAHLFFIVDGAAQVISTQVGPATTISTSNTVEAWGDRVRFAADAGAPFVNVAAGDWVIILDTGFNAANQGAWRVARVDGGATWFEIEKSTYNAETSVPMTHGSIVFARSAAQLREVVVTAGANYTANSIVDVINATPFFTWGATAVPYQTSKFRVRTNNYVDGDIALVAQNTEALKLGLTTGSAIPNLTSHLASALSGLPASPTFVNHAIASVTSGLVIVATSATGIASNQIWRSVRNFDDGAGARLRFGPAFFRDPIAFFDTGTTSVHLRHGAGVGSVPVEFIAQDRFITTWPYGLTALDDLAVLVDQDVESHRYAMNLYRRARPTTSTYGSSNQFTDSDNGGLSLALGFGLALDFSDFAVFMHARAKSHSESGDTTKTILWRSTRWGGDGNQVKVRYVYPTVANSTVGITVAPFAGTGLEALTFANVSLATDVARVGVTLRNTSRIGVMSATVGSLQRLSFILGYSITSAKRQVVLNYTARGATAFTGTLTGGTSGATGTVDFDSRTAGSGGAGFLLLSAVTGSYTAAETITGTTGSGTSSGGQTGQTTLTLDVATPGTTNTGFNPGDQLWVKSSSGSFSAGVHTLTSATVLNYTARSTSVFSGTVTGGTSGATATVISDSLVTGLSGAGYLIVSGVVGTFTPGESINGIASATLSTAAANVVAYQESTDSVAPTANIGTVSFDSQGEVTLTGSTVALNDIAYITINTGIADGYLVPVRITGLGAQYWNGIAQSSNPLAFPAWEKVLDATQVSFYPLKTASNAANVIAPAINALTNSPVTAVAVGVGGVSTGTIAQASFEEFTTVNYGYQLSDGLNWVLTPTFPIDTAHQYTLSFKDPITAVLATNSDWANEEVRLVPMTPLNVSAYLNAFGVSGLPSAAEIVRAEEGGGKVQITSLTAGSGGSVQVQGGRGNAASATVLGSGAQVGSSSIMIVTVPAADAQALTKDGHVEIQNQQVLPRAARFTSATQVSSIDNVGNIILATTHAWDFANTAAAVVDGFSWQIEQHGRYVAFRWSGAGSTPDITGVPEGSWVQITVQGGTIGSRNTGLFRVVRASQSDLTFWIENPNFAPEIVTCGLLFVTNDSVLPGDRLSISTSLFGVGNMGTFTVASIDRTNRFHFTVSGVTVPFTGPLALGTAAPLVQAVEPVPSKLVKRVLSICNNPLSNANVDVKFTTSAGYASVGSTAGSLLIALDKLGFPTTLAEGIDGYRHSIGLIGEANRVLYGDERDSATYPGVVAAGQNVNESGPLIKRIVLALGLRLLTGAVEKDVYEAVKSAVAAVVNQTGVGMSISISDIITAAGKVNGVLAVTMLSPVLSAGSDLISVQPFEKPLVLDLDDVQCSRVGVV